MNKKMNFLDNSMIRFFIRSRWYPGIFQWFAIGFFGVIVVELVIGTVNPSRNFGTSMTWVLWWPLIPVLFFVLGRFWCAPGESLNPRVVQDTYCYC